MCEFEMIFRHGGQLHAIVHLNIASFDPVVFYALGPFGLRSINRILF